MRFVTYSDGSETSWGYVTGKEGDEKIIDLQSLAPSLQAAIEQNVLAQAAQHEGKSKALSEVILQAPITAPEKFSVLVSTMPTGNAEYKDGSDAPTKPSVFVALS